MLRKALLQFWEKSNYLLVILLGSLTWIATMFKSGLIYSFGQGFWGPNGHDGIWHIALSQSFSRGEFSLPMFYGESLKNYHPGFDMFLALLNKVTTLSVSALYFQVIPVIFSVTIGFLTFKFIEIWTNSRKAALISTFFVYFGGSLSWIFAKGESAFWSQQAISTLINPPFAFSLILVLFGFIFFLKEKYFLSSLFFGSLIFIKVYAGLLILGGLLLSSLFSIYVDKNFKPLKLFFSVLLISLVLYLLFNKVSGSVLVFSPFWFLESMMQSTDRFGWTKFGEAMVNYKNGGIWFKGVVAYLVSFLIFILGNFGTRILFLNQKIKLNHFNIFIYSMILAGILIPMFFVQQATPWNTIQFFYYSLFLSSLLVGTAIEKFSSRVLFFVVLLTVPTTLTTLKDVYLPSRPPAMVANSELTALDFLRKQPEGVVLTYPFNVIEAQKAVSNPPRPLYLYESTAYVSAFSDKPVYLEDEVNLEIMGHNWEERRESVQDWFVQRDSKVAKEFLVSNKIKYIYLINPQSMLLNELDLGLTKIFENSYVTIFMVKS